MKKIFFCSFLLIFLVITAKAQYVPMQSYQYKGLAMDTLYIPTGCGMPAYTPNSYNRGAFFYDTCNFVFYKFDPTSNLWGYIGVDTITKINDSVIRVYESYTAGVYYELQINGNGAGSGGSSSWGTINGTLSDQTDLQSALDAKVPTSRTITINGTSHDLTTDPTFTVAGSGYGIDTTQIDVFLIAGQSNAQGRATDYTTSPIPKEGTAFQYFDSVISAAIDPVGSVKDGTSYGSAWPAFAVSYYNHTGHKILFVPAALGSTSQLASDDNGTGNWDVTGTLVDSSIVLLHAALDSITNRGYNPTFKGILWDQGEGDAGFINNGTIALADYENALSAMIGRYRDSLGANTPFYIFRTGTNGTHAYDSVRKGQEYVDSTDDLTTIVYRGAADFYDRDLLQPAYVHYKQAGYNEMGEVGAENVLFHQRIEGQKKTMV